mmetsp:Transcript_39800/g.102504  ORF Transcript_39800/g.102504 Transcript_39800/m.102504 type:complete len:623 (+) Transcript_39800:1100-2968(+)
MSDPGTKALIVHVVHEGHDPHVKVADDDDVALGAVERRLAHFRGGGAQNSLDLGQPTAGARVLPRAIHAVIDRLVNGGEIGESLRGIGSVHLEGAGGDHRIGAEQLEGLEHVLVVVLQFGASVDCVFHERSREEDGGHRLSPGTLGRVVDIRSASDLGLVDLGRLNGLLGPDESSRVREEAVREIGNGIIVVFDVSEEGASAHWIRLHQRGVGGVHGIIDLVTGTVGEESAGGSETIDLDAVVHAAENRAVAFVALVLQHHHHLVSVLLQRNLDVGKMDGIVLDGVGLREDAGTDRVCLCDGIHHEWNFDGVVPCTEKVIHESACGPQKIVVRGVIVKEASCQVQNGIVGVDGRVIVVHQAVHVLFGVDQDGPSSQGLGVARRRFVASEDLFGPHGDVHRIAGLNGGPGGLVGCTPVGHYELVVCGLFQSVGSRKVAEGSLQVALEPESDAPEGVKKCGLVQRDLEVDLPGGRIVEGLKRIGTDIPRDFVVSGSVGRSVVFEPRDADRSLRFVGVLVLGGQTHHGIETEGSVGQLGKRLLDRHGSREGGMNEIGHDNLDLLAVCCRIGMLLERLESDLRRRGERKGQCIQRSLRRSLGGTGTKNIIDMICICRRVHSTVCSK